MKKVYAIIAALGAGGKDLPEWYPIFGDGWSEVEGDGKFLVDEQAWSLVQAALNRRGIEIVFDYEHQTIENTKAPAAGWVKEWRYTPGIGIEAKVEWTEEAAGFLAKNEYRYHSPVFYVRKSDLRLAGIHSVALTNAPKTNQLKPLLAKLGAQSSTEGNMDRKLLIAKLGLAEDATDDQILAALDKLKTKQVAAKEVIPKEVTEALGLEPSDTSTVVASIHALKQGEKTMVSKADFEALQQKLAKRDAEEAVAAALKAGKITPDQKDWADNYAASDLAGFNTFVAKAPVVVPLGELNKQKTTPDDPALDATTQQVAKMMGVSDEDLKKYAKA